VILFLTGILTLSSGIALACTLPHIQNCLVLLPIACVLLTSGFSLARDGLWAGKAGLRHVGIRVPKNQSMPQARDA
jgi:hypothetical protein